MIVCIDIYMTYHHWWYWVNRTIVAISFILTLLISDFILQYHPNCSWSLNEKLNKSHSPILKILTSSLTVDGHLSSTFLAKRKINIPLANLEIKIILETSSTKINDWENLFLPTRVPSFEFVIIQPTVCSFLCPVLPILDILFCTYLYF